MANFWTDGKIEPKRQNRWVVHFDGIHNGNMFFATKVARPSIEVSSKQHKYLNHTFNYPGRPQWKPITLTMVDTAGSKSDVADEKGVNTMNNLMNILSKSGYVVPLNMDSNEQMGTISKAKSVNSLSGFEGSTAGAGAVPGSPPVPTSNAITISMIDSVGNTVEKWTLKNAFITKFTPSELSYEDDNIATVDIEVTYDFCTFDEALFVTGT